MNISQAGVDLIKSFEGLRLNAYQDVVGIWTIGYGHTHDVEPDDVVTRDEAEVLLREDLETFEACVNRTGLRLTQGQFDALVSFTFNVGCNVLLQSTLRQYLDLGDYQAAADEFLNWTRAGKLHPPGLLRRRQAERALFLAP